MKYKTFLKKYFIKLILIDGIIISYYIGEYGIKNISNNMYFIMFSSIPLIYFGCALRYYLIEKYAHKLYK